MFPVNIDSQTNAEYKYTLVRTVKIRQQQQQQQQQQQHVQEVMKKDGYIFYGSSWQQEDLNLTNDTIVNLQDPVDFNSTKGRFQKRACVGNVNSCGAIFAVGNHLVVRTNGCTESATNDDVLFCLDRGCVWLDNFLCNDFERGERNVFRLPINFRANVGSTVIIQKFGNQLWQFLPLEIILSPNGEFREFFFDNEIATQNCACNNGKGYTVNDDKASCVNIFGGSCPRGYRFTLGNRFIPIRPIL